MEKRIIYTGIDPSGYVQETNVLHFPLISLEMRSLVATEITEIFSKIYSYTHILFTSKYAVQAFFFCMKELNIPKEHLDPVFLLAIGRSTVKALEDEGVYVGYVGSDETEEGVIRLLETFDLEDARLLLPQAAIAKPKLVHYLVEKGIGYEVIILYDLIKEDPYTKINLNDFDEIIFTSPVGVEAFFEIYDDLPPALEVHCLGLLTRCRLKSYLDGVVVVDKKISV
jgi:uroporphyrinogen-III synthase